MIDQSTDAKRKLLIYRAADQLPFVELANALQSLLEQPPAHAGFDTLLVFLNSAAFTSCTNLKSLHPLLRLCSERRKQTRCAIVVPNLSAHAMSEMTLGELALPHVEFSCFTAEPDALAWLGHSVQN